MEEFTADLERNTELQRRWAEKDAKMKRIEEACRAVDQPMLDELWALGYEGESASQITDGFRRLPEDIVDVLLNWIARFAERHIEGLSPEARVVESWVRALVAAKKFDGRPLVKCFEATNHDSLKWAILNTISYSKPLCIDDWLKTTFQHPRWGDTLRELGVKEVK